jgi:DNA-binding GntR family transcriptional regulator
MVDAEFHIQIAAMTKNKALAKMLRTIWEHVNLRFRLDNCDPKRMPIAVGEHRELVERMKKKDVLKSVELIRAHVRSARDTCLNCLSMEEETISL